MTRSRLKLALVQESQGDPRCPLCHEPASQMHEIFVPPHTGSKYNQVYPLWAVILLCPKCNLFKANNLQKELLEIRVRQLEKMDPVWRERVRAELEEIRAKVYVKYAVPKLD